MLVIFDGTKLREIRNQRDISQAELADRADTAIRYLRTLEKGRKRKPSAELVCKFAIALDVPMETLMQIQFEEDDVFYHEREKNRAVT